MNEAIMQWSSMEMYENRLVAHEGVKDRMITDLMGTKK